MNHRLAIFRFISPARVIAVVFFALVSFWAFGQDQTIPDRPNPPRLVNDYVGILSSGEKSQLEQKLRTYNDSTSTQIVVLIVKTTDPYPIGDYSFQVGRKWGVGQQGKNNGLVLVWATDTRKVFIATGYGLEGAIPDAIAKRIVSQIIIPHFKKNEWYAGLDEATTEIIQRANGEYKSDATDEDDGGGISLFLIIFLVIIIVIWISRNRGGGGGNRTRNRGGGFFPVPFPYSTYSGWGGSSGNWGGSGGGGGGGSFGGFGGGSFGGGGAGGDY